MSRETDIPTYLDSHPVAKSHIGIAVLLCTLMVLDGIDLALLALSAPLIIEEWGLTRAEFGTPLTAALVGMVVGSVLGGWLGDRIGRRKVILYALVFFAIMTAATALATGVWSVTVLRFFAGIGFGAVSPALFALAGEIFPRSIRSRIMGILAIGIPLGGIIGSVIVLLVIPHFGWRGCFVVAGALSIAVFPLVLRYLPESPAFLYRGGRESDAREQLRRITGGSPDVLGATGANASDARADTKPGLLQRANIRLTIGASLGFFGWGMCSYGFQSWQPTLLTTQGLTLESAVQAALVFNIFATIGGLLVAVGHDALGSKLTLMISAVVGISALFGMPMMIRVVIGDDSNQLLPLFGVVAAVALSLGYAGATYYAVAAQGYPVEIRSAGLGFTSACARGGGIVMTFVGGALIGIGQNAMGFFAVLIAMVVIILISAFVINRHVSSRRSIATSSPDVARV